MTRVPGGAARPSPIRSAALLAAVDRAIGGELRGLHDALLRDSGYPGPRPNYALARALGAELAARGEAAAELLATLAAVDADEDRPQAFFPVVAAYAWAGAAMGGGAAQAQEALRDMASDDRPLVRRAVEDAVADVVARDPGRADPVADALAAWMRDYGTAACALRILVDRRVLDALRDVGRLQARLEDALALVEASTRARERDLAFRRLLEAVPEALTEAAARHAAIAAWLPARAATTRHARLREALGDVERRLRDRGERRADRGALARTLDATKKPPRDPTLLREGTRGRGKRRRGR
jgi:hypothetical protein